jgi:hypothetical protein
MAADHKSENAPLPSESELPASLGAAPGKALTPAARRALEEAAARRASEKHRVPGENTSGERDGPSGPEPTRFGDWERKGIATDF